MTSPELAQETVALRCRCSASRKIDCPGSAHCQYLCVRLRKDWWTVDDLDEAIAALERRKKRGPRP